MALTQLAPPYPIFTDKNGDPLDNGYIYFGVVNQNPETNPIQVYYDSAFTQPAAQPLRTSNGYIMRNGSPTQVYANSAFSVTVRDKNNALVIYSADGQGVSLIVALEQAEAAAAAAEAAASAASASASAAETSQTAAETAETNAEAAQTAAETAETNAEAAQTAAETAATNADAYAFSAKLSATYATLDALNAASLPDGSRATVWTVDDEVDNYLIVSGAAEWKSKSQYPTQITRTLRSQFPFPVDPAALIDPINADGFGGRCAPGFGGMDTNLYAYNSGQMPNAASFTGTLTPRFGDGPNGGKTQRIQFGSTSTTFYFFLNRFLQAGDWVASIKVKSTAGAGNQTVRFGELSDTTNVAITEAGFTEIQRTITSAGANKSLTLRGDTTNTPDVEIDEVRIHRDDASVDLPINFGAGSAMRDFGLVNSWPLESGIIKDVTSGGILKAPDWPSGTSLESYTVMIAVRREGAPGATKVLISCVTDAGFGTNINTMNLQINSTGAISAKPVNAASIPAINYCNGSWQILAIRARDGAVQVWQNGVEIATGTTANPSFDFAFLRLLGNSETSLTWDGDFGGAALWDSYLSDADLRSAFTTMQSRLEQTGQQTGRGSLIIMSEGDSRSATTSAPQGPTFAWLMRDPTYTDGVAYEGANFSRSGDGIDNVESDVPQVVRSIQNVVAMGRIPVVTLLVGVNDAADIIADATGYMERIEAVLQSYKDAGALVVACTELPKGAAAGGGTGSAWETGRAALRAAMLSSTVPDAVADIGDPTTTMGDPDGPDTDPTNWDDDLHPTSAGHILMAPVLWAAIKAAIS